MSAGNYIGYFAHLIEQGKMTEDEASKKLKELHDIDMKHDEFDREFFKNCNKAYLHSGSVLTKEQTEAIYEFAKKPIDINEEIDVVMERVYLGKFSNPIDCNDCKWLNITENEQRLGIKKGYHICKYYQQRLKHRTSRIEHDWFIYPCDECFKEHFANYSIKVW